MLVTSNAIKIKKPPIAFQFYIGSGSACIAKPNQGFEFVSWQENLGGNSTPSFESLCQDLQRKEVQLRLIDPNGLKIGASAKKAIWQQLQTITFYNFVIIYFGGYVVSKPNCSIE